MARSIKSLPAETYFQRLFPEIQFIKTENYLKISRQINHRVIEADDLDFETKLDFLLQLIEKAEGEHFVIFCQKNESVQQVNRFLNDNEIPSLEFSSSLNDTQRIENLFKFRSGKHVAFVCSDNANRGIHFDFNAHVIQFDSAQNAINLLHRFGRTGRLGNTSHVTSFVCKEDVVLLSNFQNLMDNAEKITDILSRKRAFSKQQKRLNGSKKSD